MKEGITMSDSNYNTRMTPQWVQEELNHATEGLTYLWEYRTRDEDLRLWTSVSKHSEATRAYLDVIAALVNNTELRDMRGEVETNRQTASDEYIATVGKNYNAAEVAQRKRSIYESFLERWPTIKTFEDTRRGLTA